MSEKVYMAYNPWWEGEYEPDTVIERIPVSAKVEKWLKDESIIILTGLRRVGKTTVMKLLIRKLLRQGVNPAEIFYVSLDDYALDVLSILDIIEEYRTLQRLPVEPPIPQLYL
jgi:predicted AAA+ superfamily ATPase